MSESIQVQRLAAGWRFVKTRHGDSLQAIAAREMGDAGRWAELASLNDLIPPYLTDDVTVVTANLGRVKLFGEAIRVFAPSAMVDAATDPDAVYGTDLRLTNGRLTVTNGDLETVAGLPNLAAALRRRIETTRGELIFHPDYGTDIPNILGKANGPTAAALAGRSARLALQQDDRVQQVGAVRATAAGDQLAVNAEIMPVASAAALTIDAEV